MTEKRTGAPVKNTSDKRQRPVAAGASGRTNKQGVKKGESIKRFAKQKSAKKTTAPHLTLTPKSTPKNENYRDYSVGDLEVSGGGAAAAVPSASKPKEKAKTRTIWYGFDHALFTIVLILLAFGLIMMFSASYATAYTATGDSLFYVKRQIIFAIGGIAIMLLLSTIDYHIFQSKVIVFLIAGISAALMILVKLMGTTQGGSERWLQIGEITFQPSEILKFAVIVLFAYLTEKKFEHIREFKKGFMPFALFLGFSCLLLMLQPHLSGTIIVFAIGFTMMFVAGINPKYLILMVVGLGLLVAVGLPILKAAGFVYFGDRILSFTNPEADIDDKTFQTYQSLVTIGSGGLFGLGFGNSRQKYSYLPMARNDFIFSIICEELGFVGAALVILLFVILVWRGFYICCKARDKFGMMLAFGITFQIGLQALLNIAVVTNSVPNTGISLPFFSYGGSALVMQLAEIGILLSVSRKADLG